MIGGYYQIRDWIDRGLLYFQALKRRLENTAEEELTNGVAEVKKICEIRISDILQ